MEIRDTTKQRRDTFLQWDCHNTVILYLISAQMCNVGEKRKPFHIVGTRDMARRRAKINSTPALVLQPWSHELVPQSVARVFAGGYLRHLSTVRKIEIAQLLLGTTLIRPTLGLVTFQGYQNRGCGIGRQATPPDIPHNSRNYNLGCLAMQQ
jgi:hypothetical protein